MPPGWSRRRSRGRGQRRARGARSASTSVLPARWRFVGTVVLVVVPLVTAWGRREVPVATRRVDGLVELVEELGLVGLVRVRVSLSSHRVDFGQAAFEATTAGVGFRVSGFGFRLGAWTLNPAPWTLPCLAHGARLHVAHVHASTGSHQ